MNDDIIFWGGKLLLEVISLKLLLYQKKIKMRSTYIKEPVFKHWYLWLDSNSSQIALRLLCIVSAANV